MTRLNCRILWPGGSNDRNIAENIAPQSGDILLEKPAASIFIGTYFEQMPQYIKIDFCINLLYKGYNYNVNIIKKILEEGLMKNKYFIFLILIIPVFVFALSGCKGGSTQPSSSASTSPAVVKAASASASSLSPGLWKMTVRSTTQMPSMAGRPAVDRTYNTIITSCVKQGSKQAKPYMPSPKNFKCSTAKEHMGADGTIHWAVQCKSSRMTFTSKGKSKITASSFTSHAITTETTGASGFSMKTIMDTNGKLISNKCPSKS